MQWEDRGIVLSVRPHGERDVILEMITRLHGRHFGLVRSGRSQRNAPFLQPGNTLDLVWRARLEEHLGQFTTEPQVNRIAHVLSNPMALNALGHVAFLVRLLPEREPHEDVFFASEALCNLFGHLHFLAVNLVRFELMVLGELGFGLDFESCAATGDTEDLAYVSPKSGRAVSRAAGLPWHDKLLILPEFLKDSTRLPQESMEFDAILAGFRVTGHFLERHVIEPRGLAPRNVARLFWRGCLPRAAKF